MSGVSQKREDPHQPREEPVRVTRGRKGKNHARDKSNKEISPKVVLHHAHRQTLGDRSRGETLEGVFLLYNHKV